MHTNGRKTHGKNSIPFWLFVGMLYIWTDVEIFNSVVNLNELNKLQCV